jgi:hypothetical protein
MAVGRISPIKSPFALRAWSGTTGAATVGATRITPILAVFKSFAAAPLTRITPIRSPLASYAQSSVVITSPALMTAIPVFPLNSIGGGGGGSDDAVGYAI